MLSTQTTFQAIIFRFRVFDKDGNGFITIDELEMTMLSLGETLTPLELQEMMDEVDNDRDGKVSFRKGSKANL